MSGESDPTVDPVKRSLDPETAVTFETRIQTQADWLRDAIADGVMDNADLTVGLELEAYAVTGDDVTGDNVTGDGVTGDNVTGDSVAKGGDSDDDTAGDSDDGCRAPRLVRLPDDVFADPAVNKELGLHNVEVNTDPTVLDGPGLAAQADEIRARTRAARSAVRDHGHELVLDGLWTLPPAEGSMEYLSAVEERDGIVLAGNMRRDPRYVAIDNHALDYADCDGLPLSVPGCDRTFPTILFESLATSIQPHLQVPTAAELPAYYNAAIRTLGPVLALSANSPFLPPDVYGDVDDPESLVEETHHELRIAVFEQSVNHTPNAKVSVPRDIETPTDVVDRVLEDDLYAPFLREWIEGETPRDGLADRIWEVDHKRGTYWRWLRCVVGGSHVDADNDDHSLRIEYRPIPTQPTVTDVIGVQALVVGLIHGLVEADHPVGDLPWRGAEASFYHAAEAGMDADLEWVTAAGERTADRDVIFDEVFAHARLGLSDAGIPETDIDRYLSPIEARWDAGTTPSDWKRDRVERALADGADLTAAIRRMQREYVERSRETDSFADWI